MPPENEGRWPPIYDFNELQTTIQSLVGSVPLEKLLYESGRSFPDFYQGDIIQLPSELPYIDENAESAAEETTKA